MDGSHYFTLGRIQYRCPYWTDKKGEDVVDLIAGVVAM